MPSIINTNLASLNAQRNLSTSQSALNLSIQRLSSGLRVNSAKDDAAGLAIGNRMDTQVRGMTVAMRNAADAVSMAQTAEGGLVEITNMLQRMRELAVQAANGSNSSADVALLGAEYAELSAEITRVVGSTRFNGATVLNQTAATVFQVGPDAADTISVAAIAPNLSGLGALTDNASGTAQMAAIDTVLTNVNSTRATLGAVQNRFESTISNLRVAAENQAAARSRIMDADFAAETAALTRAQILQQAGTAMLAQANAQPNTVLTLLRG